MGGPAPRVDLNFKYKRENEDSKPPIIKQEEIELGFIEEKKPVIDLKLEGFNDSKDASILTKRPRSPSVYEDVTDMPQPQRRRLILDAVVIIRRQVPPQKDRAQELENSVTDVKIDIKVKVKKYRQDTHFSLSIVHERLKDVKEFIVNLEPGEEDFIVTRDFTSHVYGGSSQATVPTIAEVNFKKHGFDDFLYPSQDYNPHAPGKAGAHGMMFGVGPYAREWPGIHRVIVGIGPKQWMYVGQYKLIPAPSMSVEEWSQTNIKVRKAWAAKIARRWGWHVRARITLRKRLGREPTQDEINGTDEPFLDLTEDEVMEAFTKGEETIAVWYFECVGFDYDFYRQMIEKYRSYQANPPPRKERRNKGPKQSKQGVIVRNAKTKKVRVDRQEEASDEEKESFELVYHPKGTASRPRK